MFWNFALMEIGFLLPLGSYILGFMIIVAFCNSYDNEHD